jgi:chemotaxis protein MotA
MFTLVGLCIVMVMVFGGYTLAGGHLSIIMKALPFELIMIGGAGVGTFLMANDTRVLKQVLGDLVRTVKGSRWRKQDYIALLCLMFELVRLARTDPIALEAHIENPETSDIFGRYPQVRADRFALALICDYLRASTMSFSDPHQVGEIMERDLELRHAEALRPANAMQTITDALPALGIVAAVLGVIKTMASIDQPPSVLGKMIGGALVGTFLGVFLSYCLTGPSGGAHPHDARGRPPFLRADPRCSGRSSAPTRAKHLRGDRSQERARRDPTRIRRGRAGVERAQGSRCQAGCVMADEGPP